MDVPSNAYTEPITPSHASSRRPRVQGIEGAAPAAAAEFPKTGSAEYDTYFIENTGKVPYTVVLLHDTVDGRQAYIVNHKATWEIK